MGIGVALLLQGLSPQLNTVLATESPLSHACLSSANLESETR
jgi:hypothetical protein